MTRAEWAAAEKAVDPNYEGSISQKVGFDRELCPACGAHLKSGICLNACHLGDDGAKRFSAFMANELGKGK